jgi:hypothetical protein
LDEPSARGNPGDSPRRSRFKRSNVIFLVEKGKIEPEKIIIGKRPALLGRYPTCCSCNKLFLDSIQDYHYIVLVKSGVSLPSEPCCKECLSKFTGISIEELMR